MACRTPGGAQAPSYVLLKLYFSYTQYINTVYYMSSDILGEFVRGLRWVGVARGGGYRSLRGPRIVSCALRADGGVPWCGLLKL